MTDTQILRTGDAGHDEARQVWNALVDRRPALVVRCREASDVVAAVGLARRECQEIGVRCGGHGVVGLAVPELTRLTALKDAVDSDNLLHLSQDIPPSVLGAPE